MGLASMLRRGVLALGATAMLAFPALAQQGQPIRIGAVLSVTGPASFLGDPEDKTLRLYVNRINAAGGVNPNFTPGDVMLILDQINIVGMAGLNPLIGPNINELGLRFPDMSQPYDREYIDLARKVAKEKGIQLQEGIYTGLSGPSFESPADLRFLRMTGTDAVGMSTVPEVIIARHGNMRVLGISGISNKANLDGSTITSHEEVMEAGKIITPKIETIVRGALPRM